jgi:glycerate 2-kinase
MTQQISSLRDDATAAFTAAVSSVQPVTVIPRVIDTSGPQVLVAGQPLPRASGRQLVAAVGKAAPGLAEAWLNAFPDWSDDVIVLAPHGVSASEALAGRVQLLRGAHPYPDAEGEASARRLLAEAVSLGPNDLLIVLLSGGGSALLAAPEKGLTLGDIQATTKSLLTAGAPITSVNAVRRQLLAAAGGGLGRAAAPAPVVTLVLSDVIGDPLPSIASGPTVPSSTNASDALAELSRFHVTKHIPSEVTRFLEQLAAAPAPDDSWEASSRIQVVANNRTAVAAAADELRGRGYRVWEDPRPLEGEASERGQQLAGLANILGGGPSAVVFGGETTVTVSGKGVGGRNLELALAGALALQGHETCGLLAGGTDGVDGMSRFAGAFVDGGTVQRIRAAGRSPEQDLANNDASTALEASDDAIFTGPTGTNVCDITIVLGRE